MACNFHRVLLPWSVWPLWPWTGWKFPWHEIAPRISKRTCLCYRLLTPWSKWRKIGQRWRWLLSANLGLNWAPAKDGVVNKHPGSPKHLWNVFSFSRLDGSNSPKFGFFEVNIISNSFFPFSRIKKWTWKKCEVILEGILVLHLPELLGIAWFFPPTCNS